MSGQGRVAPPASAPVNSFPPILTEIPQISTSAPHFSPRGLSPPPPASSPCDPPLGSTPPPKNRRTKPTFSPMRDQDPTKNSSDYSFSSPLRKDDSLGEVRSSSPSQLDLQCPRSPSPPRTSTTPPPDHSFTAASPTKTTAPSPTTTPGFAISRGNSSPRNTETSPGFADGKGGIPPVKKRRASARRSSPPPLTFARSSSPTSPRRMRGEKSSWIGTKPRKEATAPVRSPSFSPPLSPNDHRRQRAYSPVSASTSSSSHSPPVSSSPLNTSPNPPLLPPPSSTSFDLSSHDGPMKSKDSDDLAKSQSIVIGDPIQKSHTTTSILSSFSAKDRTKTNEFDEPDLTSTASSPSSTTAPAKKMIRQPKKKRLSTLHGTPMSSSMGSASFPQPSLSCSSRGASTTKKTKRTASPSSLHQSADLAHCRSEDRLVKNWGDLVYYHNSKIKVIFEELLGTRVPNFMQPVMCEADYKTFSVDDADNNEKQLYDARTTLLTFQENVHEHFERLFGLLSFLPLPWDENTLSEVFHYKWMVVSFSTTADLDHLGALASAYQESCKSLYKAERERSKRRGILSKGLLGRFGKGRDKDKKGDDSQSNLFQCDLKAVEKSLPTSVLNFFRTMGNLIKFAEKFRMDPNGVVVGSEPCDTLLAELSHLPLLSEMTHEQQQFNRKNAPSPPPTALNNKKKGRGNKEQNSGPLAPTPPEPKKKNAFLDEEVTIEIPEDVPITCLNTNMGAFPDRVQMIQRFVLWGRMLEEDFERNDVAEEMEKLEKILAAELWLEQVWQEGGGLLIPGEILIGIIPETEIQRVIESTKKYSTPEGGGEEITGGEGDDPSGASPALLRMQQVGRQVGMSSYPLMFCRYVGTRRHGLLVEIGGICGEPIFLTWQQAVPLPDSWKKLVRRGEVKDVEELVAEEKVRGRYSRKEKGGLKRVVTNNKLALEPTVLSLSAYASRE